MGLFSSLFGGKTKTKSRFAPWDQAEGYITGEGGNFPDGQEGNPGLFKDAYSTYRSGGFNPQMQGAQDLYSQYLNSQANDPRMGLYKDAGFDLLSGARRVGEGGYDTNFKPVASVGMPDARNAQGVLDPTNAMQSLLSGTPNNPYLDQQAAAITGQLTRNMNENVMPGIRSGAINSGQYGGSRQGIAEGQAISRLNQDLAPALTNLYGNAYENAQGRMMGTANALNDQAYNTAFGNANLGLQNNAQQMQQNTQNLTNRMQSIPLAQGGLGLMSGANDLRGQMYQNQINSAMLPQQTNWNNLNNYANLMYQGAGLGGSSSGTQSQSTGIIPSILGTAAGIGGIASGFGGMAGMASKLGSGASGLSAGASGMFSGAAPMFSGASSYPRLTF